MRSRNSAVASRKTEADRSASRCHCVRHRESFPLEDSDHLCTSRRTLVMAVRCASRLNPVSDCSAVETLTYPSRLDGRPHAGVCSRSRSGGASTGASDGLSAGRSAGSVTGSTMTLRFSLPMSNRPPPGRRPGTGCRALRERHRSFRGHLRVSTESAARPGSLFAPS
jgi:hypothetical protein